MRAAPRPIIAVVLVVLLVAVGWFFWSGRQEPAKTVTYRTISLQRGPLSQQVSATGTLNPLNTVQVGSQVSGRIESLSVDFNSQVKKGQVIAQLDASLFKTEVAQAEAKLKSSEAALEKAAVRVRETARQVQRLTELRQKRLAAESDVDTAHFAHEAAQADQRVQQATVTEAKAALEQAQVNLAHTTIYAPIDGVVIARSVDVGQTVAASLQAPVLFLIAKDLSQMQIETQVDEAFIGAIKEGQAVRFTVFAYPDRVFPGQVTQVRLNPTVESGVVKYNCIIGVDNRDFALKPGMTATVTIETDHRENVFVVPSGALRFVPDWPANKLNPLREKLGRDQGIVWTLADGDIAPLAVKIGLVGEKMTQIDGEALREGLPIVVPSKDDASRDSGRPRGLRLF